MEDDAWTTGDDSKLKHVRLIAYGGFGEVHELSNEVTEEVFARKLLLAGRQLHPKEIQNEIRAVLKVCCGETPHPNIVKVLRHGTLPITRHVYLDLELCEFNLEWYIKKRLWKPTGEELSETGSSRLPQLELLTRARYIWVIMMQVASGLEFIHGLKEVHRDLKPRNVLYSYQEHLWKVADFGFSAEGTTSMARTSALSRGTSGYRAPELLRQDKATFTNKVDIFAAGCMFFEMAFRKKLFETDFALLEYVYTKTKPSIPTDKLSYSTKDEVDRISSVINATLDLSPFERPTSKHLRATCATACDWRCREVLTEVERKIPPTRNINFTDSVTEGPGSQGSHIGFSLPAHLPALYSETYDTEGRTMFENEVSEPRQPWQTPSDKPFICWKARDWATTKNNDILGLVHTRDSLTGYVVIVLKEVKTGACLLIHKRMIGSRKIAPPSFSPCGKYACSFNGDDILFVIDISSSKRHNLKLYVHDAVLGFALFTKENLAVICGERRALDPGYRYYALYVLHESGKKSNVQRRFNSRDGLEELMYDLTVSFGESGGTVFVTGHTRCGFFVHTYDSQSLKLVQRWETNDRTSRIKSIFSTRCNQQDCLAIAIVDTDFDGQPRNHQTVVISRGGEVLFKGEQELKGDFLFPRMFTFQNEVFLLYSLSESVEILLFDKKQKQFRVYGQTGVNILNRIYRRLVILEPCGLTGAQGEVFWWWDKGKINEIPLILNSEIPSA